MSGASNFIILSFDSFCKLINSQISQNDDKMTNLGISSTLKYDEIIDEQRIYHCFRCSAFERESVYLGFNWLLDTLKQIEVEKKQNAKLVEMHRKLESMDLDKLGPNAKNPRCAQCGVSCSDQQGVCCTVCGKWQCERDALDHMVKRKSGNSKCRRCVGQVSIFGKGLGIK